MRRLAVGLAVLALGAGLSGCGDDDDGGGGGSASGDKDRFCELASQEEIEGLEDFDPTDAESMDALDDALDDVEDAAPDEIRDDVAVVAEGVRALVDALEGIDTSDPEALSQLSERAEELEGMQAEMEAASERVDRYLEEECGIEPDE